MQINIKSINKELVQRLDITAANAGMSRNQYMITLIENATDDAAMVIAYTRIAYLGDVNADEDMCPFCDENLIAVDPHLAHYANGQIVIVCGVCAESAD